MMSFLWLWLPPTQLPLYVSHHSWFWLRLLRQPSLGRLATLPGPIWSKFLEPLCMSVLTGTHLMVCQLQLQWVLPSSQSQGNKFLCLWFLPLTLDLQLGLKRYSPIPLQRFLDVHPAAYSWPTCKLLNAPEGPDSLIFRAGFSFTFITHLQTYYI
jgi:hypothetical protein